MILLPHWIISGIVVLLVIFCCHRYTRQGSRFRLFPGPFAFPIIGNLLQFGAEPHATFLKWTQKYGNLFTIHIGPRSVLVLNNYKVIYEALVKKGKIFNNRLPSSLLRLEAGGLGILNNDGSSWSEIRRFTMSCLKDKGFGRISMEGKIHEEIAEFIDDFQKSDAHPIDPQSFLTISVANVLWSLVAGHRFQRQDPKLLELADMNDAIIRNLGNVGLMTFFPQLKFIFRGKYNQMHGAMHKLRKFLHREIDVHLTNLQIEEHEPVDLIDGFLKQAKEERDSSKQTIFTDDQVVAILLDLFVAGIETTVTSIRWILLFFLQHPLLQKKVQQELDEIVGADRLPSNEDRLRMPYTEAILAEMARYSCVIPVFFHSTAEETELSGFHVPERTPVLINNWGIHRDPECWKSPDKLDFTRFLDSEGNFCKPESFGPFGIGRRACPGESLARMEIFLLVTSILQKFDLVNPPHQELPPKVLTGLVRAPASFNVIFKSRNSL